jgi:hypothetical protein
MLGVYFRYASNHAKEIKSNGNFVKKFVDSYTKKVLEYFINRLLDVFHQLPTGCP